MKKGLLGILAVGFMATAANAATLGLRFAGGATEVTMGPGASDSVTIEVLLTFDALKDGGKNPSKISSGNFRFDVGSLTAGVGGSYIQDGSTKFVVADHSTANPGWTTSGSSPVGSPFNRLGFFFAPEDPTGTALISGAPARTIVLGSFTIHKALPSGPDDTYIAFRVEDPLPGLSEGPTAWGGRWQYDVELARNNWLLTDADGGGSSPGNPGDNDPRWAAHGYETLNPLIIHNLPEPSALALLALGGLAMLRRRN